jgi:hypothetical protein
LTMIFFFKKMFSDVRPLSTGLFIFVDIIKAFD